MATNIPVPAAQAALSLLSLSSGQSSTPSSAPALGRFVHTPRSSASVVRPSASPTTIAPKRRPSSSVQKRRMSDATREPTVDPSESIAGGKAKKGTIFKCETCQKVYRHPNCLVKHRWEHSPHWREASKFLLSKHQQVQMLEAAAILSHISPHKNGVGTSLPEDRSLWPAYLSGGLLPTPGTGTSVPTIPPTAYREREVSVSTSAMDDEENNTGESSAEDEHEDSGYGSSSAAAPPPVAVPGFRPAESFMAMSVGGHEYAISSSHAACDAGAHIGSMAMPFSRSISASSFGLSSMRGRDEDEEEAGEVEPERKWDEDESMAMDMDL